DWEASPFGYGFVEAEEPSPLLGSLVELDDPKLIKDYLTEVLAKDASVDPGKSLPKACQKHGWSAFRPELEVVFKKTTAATIARNVRLLEQLCVAKPKQKEEWLALGEALARSTVKALEEID